MISNIFKNPKEIEVKKNIGWATANNLCLRFIFMYM